MKGRTIGFWLFLLYSIAVAGATDCSAIANSAGQSLADGSCSCLPNFAWSNGGCQSIPIEPAVGDDDDRRGGGDSESKFSLSTEAKYALIYSLCLGLPALIIGCGLCMIRKHKQERRMQLTQHNTDSSRKSRVDDTIELPNRTNNQLSALN